MVQSPTFKLTVCIPTFNRAGFLSEALDSIIPQCTEDCEIVVSDNASTDSTAELVSEYARRFDRLRYVRQAENIGCDRNSDLIVELARGEYCWLFADDDVMKPDAIATVLDAIRQGHSLVLVNGEHRDFTMSSIRVPSFFCVDADRVYASSEFDRLFEDVGICIMCLCCVVIKRSVWITRERQRYYGSWFLHTAVVFQEPLPGNTFVIARPLMSLRLGNNQTAQAASFHVWYMCWPELLWSFPLKESTKRKLHGPRPWTRCGYLLATRAVGGYSLADYKTWLRPRLQTFGGTFLPTIVALLPRKAAYHLYRIFSLATGRPRSPRDALWTMFPKSLRTLQES